MSAFPNTGPTGEIKDNVANSHQQFCVVLTPIVLWEVGPAVFNKETPTISIHLIIFLKLKLGKEKEGHLPLMKTARFEFHG